MDELRLIPLDARHLQDFERLLSGKEFGGCYCAVWSNKDDQWEDRCKNRPHENLDHTSKRVRAGEKTGYLVCRESDGAIVAWTGSGPKTAFPSLKDRPGAKLGTWSDSVWAIACLAVGFAYRGRGYSRQIIKLVVDEAKARGASAIEAYPVEPESEDASYRGTRKLFEIEGFKMADAEPAGDIHAVRMLQSFDGPAPEVPSEEAGGDLTTS